MLNTRRSVIHLFTRIMLLVAAVLAMAMAPVEVAKAGTGRIYLTPSTKTLSSGNEVTLELRIDPGTDVQGIQANIAYDANKLRLVSTSDSETAFPNILAENLEHNPMDTTRSVAGNPVNSDSLIFTLRFSALTGSGSTSITLTGNAVYNNTPTNPATEGATITFTGGSGQGGSSGASGPGPAGQPGPSQNTQGTPSGTSSGNSGDASETADGQESGSDDARLIPVSGILPDSRLGDSKMFWVAITTGALLASAAGYVIIRRHRAAADDFPPSIATPVTYSELASSKTSHIPADPKLQETLEHLPGVRNPEPGSTINPAPKDENGS